MTTAVDTNILVDVLRGDPDYAPASAAALRDSISRGRLVACEVVWAEIGALFTTADLAAQTLQLTGISMLALSAQTALLAGQRWRAYRRSGGPRTRVIADFLIGAHALVQADRLLTRDRGYFQTHFPDLVLVDPQS